MTTIRVTITNNNVPTNALGDDPEINIRRLDTGALVVTGSAMIDAGGDGLYTFDFTPVAGLDYSFLIDADPNVSSQVTVAERYYDGAFDNERTDIWNDRGLNPVVPKTILEVVADEDYDEDVASSTSIHKDVTKVGVVTTIDRT